VEVRGSVMYIGRQPAVLSNVFLNTSSRDKKILNELSHLPRELSSHAKHILPLPSNPVQSRRVGYCPALALSQPAQLVDGR